MKNLADQSASIETPTTEHPRNLEQLWLSMFDLEASEGILKHILCQNYQNLGCIAIVSCPAQVDKTSSRCAQDFQTGETRIIMNVRTHLEVDSLDEGVPSRARLGKSFFVHTCQ